MGGKKGRDRTRVLIFDEDGASRAFIRKFLEKYDFVVEDDASPRQCPLFKALGKCCTQKEACADIQIFDDYLKGVRALDFIQRQAVGGCKTLIGNKLVICSIFNAEDNERAKALGVTILHRPFPLAVLKKWVDACLRRLKQEKR